MDDGSIELRQLRDVVADKPAFIRCILDRDEDGWTLGYIEAIVGKRPPGWQPIAWEYDAVTLVAQELAGSALATALDGAGRRSLPVGSYQAEVPALQQQHVQGRHEPSCYRLDRPSLPWPVWDYSVYRQGGGSERQQQYGLLIGDGPSFPNFETAFLCIHDR